ASSRSASSLSAAPMCVFLQNAGAGAKAGGWQGVGAARACQIDGRAFQGLVSPESLPVLHPSGRFHFRDGQTVSTNCMVAIAVMVESTLTCEVPPAGGALAAAAAQRGV